MALVPYSAALVGGHAIGAGLQNLNPKQKKLVKKIVETHALYNVPYMTKAGAVATQIRNQPRTRAASRSFRSVAAPAAIGTTSISTQPRIGGSSSPGGGGSGKSVRVTHSALFGSVSGTTALSVQTFRLNPGISDVFPWLSGIAGVFDMYRIVNASVRYVPVTGTDTEGALYVAWDPDPTDPVPTTKSQIMAFASAVTGPVWKSFSLKIPSLGPKYVRRGEVVGAALNTYDNGQLFVCTQSADSQLLGDLYVDYTIELIMPHVYSSNGALYQPQFFAKSGGTIAKATPFGTLPPLSYGPVCLDTPNFTYPSSGVLRAPILNVVSYDNGQGTRAFRLVVDLGFVGTGVDQIAQLTCSDSGATVTLQKVVLYSTTELMRTYSVSWTRPPLPGSYLTVDVSAATTITMSSFDVTQVPDGTSGTWLSNS